MWTNLDILRAIAVLAVFLCHIIYCVSRCPAEINLFVEAIGRIGVIIFFVHTSLVLMCSMERTRHESNFIIRFYVRRAFRIYPLAIVVVLCAYFLHLPPNAWSQLIYKPIGLFRLSSNLLLVQNVTQQKPVLGVLWSLPLEMQMYILLPALFFLIEGINWHKKLGITFITAGISAAICWYCTGKLNLLAFIPCFLAGALAFKRARHVRILPSLAWPVLVLILIIGLAVFPLYLDHFLQPTGIFIEWMVAIILGYHLIEEPLINIGKRVVLRLGTKRG